MYEWIRGPFVWLAFFVFLVGTLGRIAYILIISRQKDKVFYDHADLSWMIRSIVGWLIPWGSYSWRQHPLTTLLVVVFHAILVFVPLFALGHAVSLYESFGVDWPAISEGLADGLTSVFLLSAAGLLYRRLVLPHVRIVTSFEDYLVLALTVAPFLTGFMAYRGVGEPEVMLSIHILAGGLMLMAIPFTKLSHAFFFFLTRANIGSEMGARRGTKTW